MIAYVGRASTSALPIAHSTQTNIDVAAAVLASPYAVEILAREGATPGQRRTAIRTAVLLARIG